MNRTVTNSDYAGEESQVSKTDKNLQLAFAGESQAHMKYLAFAEQADKEGYPLIAKLFRTAAEGEKIHALAHLKNEIKSTRENLLTAMRGETFEFRLKYPEMIRQASEEGRDSEMESFQFANDVKDYHTELFEKALEHLYLENLDEGDYFICSVCGCPTKDSYPDKCPVCKHERSFKKVK